MSCFCRELVAASLSRWHQRLLAHAFRGWRAAAYMQSFSEQRALQCITHMHRLRSMQVIRAWACVTARRAHLRATAAVCTKLLADRKLYACFAEWCLWQARKARARAQASLFTHDTSLLLRCQAASCKACPRPPSRRHQEDEVGCLF